MGRWKLVVHWLFQFKKVTYNNPFEIISSTREIFLCQCQLWKNKKAFHKKGKLKWKAQIKVYSSNNSCSTRTASMTLNLYKEIQLIIEAMQFRASTKFLRLDLIKLSVTHYQQQHQDMRTHWVRPRKTSEKETLWTMFRQKRSVWS